MSCCCWPAAEATIILVRKRATCVFSHPAMTFQVIVSGQFARPRRPKTQIVPMVSRYLTRTSGRVEILANALGTASDGRKVSR